MVEMMNILYTNPQSEENGIEKYYQVGYIFAENHPTIQIYTKRELILCRVGGLWPFSMPIFWERVIIVPGTSI